MRDIRFRAWDGKRMINIMEVYFCLDVLCGYPEYKDWDVMQYTGIKDKNGVEIYEGDVLSGFNGELTVEMKWSNEDGGYYVSEINRVSGGMATMEYLQNFKVIGNIHENPELI